MAVKTKTSKLGKLKSLMREHKRSFIILIPEEHDDAPHWLFWLLLILIFIFFVSWLWSNWSGAGALMSYLSY
ncbi:hypothetical protein A2810_01910 [candidate division Kazan bacterium RIFCSPHIGHO2_01_FULL_49_10]|uniref:Uncharacterized protein n=1 Tax=candidate division Kazan bacterium RIFCSPLOWO2_01_FULL_48_13 TaxID=1798539 RepID=A0A1F4PN26_UNCK3|nr:MAG: hypothetical protein A2810_01910 [candidate division Kazan bacterium RIFCSPHIGHO2_01_FULL_49_10]OGB85087.1 MAG: hypothetical protein A2994_00560 [candidate division Kazan bacterium RIFCSPLOWO2_01_FULL_48_13]